MKELKKRRTFRKFTYREVDLDQLLDMNNEQPMELFVCRIRRKFSKGLKRKPMALIKSCGRRRRKLPPMKPNVVETHISRLRAKVDRPFDSELIQTVRGAGYRIDA